MPNDSKAPVQITRRRLAGIAIAEAAPSFVQVSWIEVEEGDLLRTAKRCRALIPTDEFLSLVAAWMDRVD